VIAESGQEVGRISERSYESKESRRSQSLKQLGVVVAETSMETGRISKGSQECKQGSWVVRSSDFSFCELSQPGNKKRAGESNKRIFEI
jgi:hypothetical protein